MLLNPPLPCNRNLPLQVPSLPLHLRLTMTSRTTRFLRLPRPLRNELPRLRKLMKMKRKFSLLPPNMRVHRRSLMMPKFLLRILKQKL